MVDEIKSKGSKKAEAAKAEDDGHLDKQIKVNEQTNIAAERMEKVIARQEQLMSDMTLAGRAEAGVVPEKPKEETPEEYSMRVLSGDVNPFKVK